MLTIFFANRDETMFMYEKLLIQSITTFKYTSIKLVNETQIYIQCRKSKQICIQKMLLPLLIEMLMVIKEKQMIMQILEQQFFYTNKEEQLQISQLASFIMKEGHINVKDNITTERRTLLKLLQKFFKDIPPTFSLDAFLQFRAKSYMKFLQHITECAIDEYKLELDYQKYLQDVRNDIDKNHSRQSVVHVYLGKEYYIFDDVLQLLHLFPEKEQLLPILIELIPKQIFLYTNYIDDSFTAKILNIFQEKVMILKQEEFLGSLV